ncbi:Trehalase [Trichoplax sp. H2]|nr:Trehalase [Trichoplax sp. H2]|eukprot:RDD42449.1 Trehalase [Trichoplax sp. H2]
MVGKLVFASILCLAITGVVSQQSPNAKPCDSEIFCYGDLLRRAQDAYIFNDSKSFVDMKLKDSPTNILAAFRNLAPNADIKAFVKQYFSDPAQDLEAWTPTDWKENPAVLNKIKDSEFKKFAKALNELWKVLGRRMKDEVQEDQNRTSLIYVPNPFVVPGGRFREFYYWDTFWVVGGLLVSDMEDTVKAMIGNFEAMVDRFGFVPNGGRIYYTRRSQPPFFIPMINSYYEATNDLSYVQSLLSKMEKEYNFWMNNRTVDIVRNGKTYTLNRYAVDMGMPRPESYREDVETAKNLNPNAAAELYSDIASAAESGWDFSSRWFKKPIGDLSSIVTKQIIPVDLNAILCFNELTLEKFSRMLGDNAKADRYKRASEARRDAIEGVLWDEYEGRWLDYDLLSKKPRTDFMGSVFLPMWAKCYDSFKGNVTKERKIHQALKAMKIFDFAGGIPTTLLRSGQQWDYPNSWPPLQQMAVAAMSGSEAPELKDEAFKLAQKWLLTNWRSWKSTGYMYEKFDAAIPGNPGRGGEYNVQVGFGWSNGVCLEFLSQYGDKVVADHNKTTTGAAVGMNHNQTQVWTLLPLLLLVSFLLYR